MENIISPVKPLPDIISKGLDVLFVGFNPGVLSAQAGHHYAGKSNRFWRLLFEAGLTPHRFRPEEDIKLLELKFGSTNIAGRPSKSADLITADEYKMGSVELAELIRDNKPKIACYIGIGVYRIFRSNISGIPLSRLQICTGLQETSLIKGVTDYVCSNPSGLNTIPYPEQLECMEGLKRLIAELKPEA